MILEAIGIASAAAALIQTARRGVPVSSGTVGDAGTDSAVRWRVRWAIWRWIAEVESPLTGWSATGEFATKKMAAANARVAARGYMPEGWKPKRAAKIR